MNDEFIEYELINAIFEPSDSTHGRFGTSDSDSSSDMPWNEKKRDDVMVSSKRKR